MVCCRLSHSIGWTLGSLSNAKLYVSVVVQAIVFVIVIAKNFNRRNSHGHLGSKRRELAQHAHSLPWIARFHLHTL